MAERPAGAKATPFGPRFDAPALYLKTFQALSYERLEGARKDLFGLTVSQGGLSDMLGQAEAQFAAGRDTVLAALHRAKVVACDVAGIGIEVTNSVHRLFRCAEAVVHHVAPTRAASMVRDVMAITARMGGCRTAIQPGKATERRTRHASPTSPVTSPTRWRAATRPWRWRSSCGSAFALADAVTTLATSSISAGQSDDVRPRPCRPAQDPPGPRSTPDLHALPRPGRAHQQRLRERPSARPGEYRSGALRARPMAPEVYAAFVRGFTAEWNAARKDRAVAQERQNDELKRLARKIDNYRHDR